MTDLTNLLLPYRRISIIGMDKNAGKTTTLNRLISDFNKRGTSLALTSIGRDGEESDIVTNTAKPRIFVQSGTTIITAEALLEHCDITKEIIHVTNYHTAMGRVVIVVAKSDGYVQIGGPSTVSQLETLVDWLSKEKRFASGKEGRFAPNHKIIIDGAISRKSTARLSDAVILCAGAGLSPDMRKVIAETRYAAHILSLKKPCDSTEHIYLEGAVSDMRLSRLITSGGNLKGTCIVADDPSKIFIRSETYEKLLIKKCALAVKSPLNLVAVTVNPVSTRGYAFDAAEFLAKMQEALPMPVFDVQLGSIAASPPGI